MNTLESIAEKVAIPVSGRGTMFGTEPTVFVGNFHDDPIGGRGIDTQVPGAAEGHYGIRYIGGMGPDDAMIVHASCKEAAKPTFDHLQSLGIMDMPWNNIVAVGDDTHRTVMRCLENPSTLRDMPRCVREALTLTPFALTPSVERVAKTMGLSVSRDTAATERTGNKALALGSLQDAPVTEGASVFSAQDALRTFRDLHRTGGGVIALKVGRASSGFGIFFAATEEEFLRILSNDKVRIALSPHSNVLEGKALNLTPHNAIGARVERWIGTGETSEEVLCSMGIVLDVTRNDCRLVAASQQILHPGEEDDRFDASHEGNLSPTEHLPDDVGQIVKGTVSWLRSIDSFGITGMDVVVSRTEEGTRGRIVELNARPTASMAGSEVAKKLGLKAWMAQNIAIPADADLDVMLSRAHAQGILMRRDGEEGVAVLNHAIAFGGKCMVLAGGNDCETVTNMMKRFREALM